MNYTGMDKNGKYSLPAHSKATYRSRLPLALCATSALALTLTVLSPRSDDTALAADPSPKNQAQLLVNDPVLQAQLSRGIEKNSLEQMAMKESDPQAG